MGRLPKKGSLTTEYAVLIAVTISALLVMSVYMRRAIAGGIRKSADAIGEQYAPGQVTSDMTTTASGASATSSQSTRTPLNGKNVVTVDSTTTIPNTNPETTTVTGSETIGPLGTDLWN